MEWISVSKEDFDSFISKYQNKLNVDVAQMFDPPIKTYNDFTLGVWPDSAVCYISLCYMNEKMELVDGESEFKYFINKRFYEPSIQLEDFTLPPVNLPVIGRAK